MAAAPDGRPLFYFLNKPALVNYLLVLLVYIQDTKGIIKSSKERHCPDKNKKLPQAADVTKQRHCKMSTETTDFKMLANIAGFQEAAQKLFEAQVLSTDELKRGKAAPVRSSNNAKYRNEEMDNEQTITNGDIESLMASISQRFPSLPPETLSGIKASLLMNVGAPKTNFSEMVAQAMNQARSANDEIATNQQPLSLQEQLVRFINEMDKKISGLLGSMEDDGVVFDEGKKKRMTELQAWVEAHPDDKKSEQYKEYVSLQREMADDAERQADDPNSTVHNRPDVKRKCAQIKLTDEERQKLQKDLDEKNKQENDKNAAKVVKGGMVSEDDDEPSVAKNSAPQFKIEVADVTHNDIQAPTGGKNRSTGRDISLT